MNQSPDTAGSLPISPPQHEAFAKMMALGASAAAAYKKHISPTAENESLWMAASRLTKNDKVAMRVNYLRGEAGKVALKNFGIDAETIILQHMEIVSTPVSEIDETHPLCVKLKRSRRLTGAGQEKQAWEVEEVSKPCVSRSLEALANLTGMNAPQKVESTVNIGPPSDSLEDMLRTPACIAAVVGVLATTPEGLEAMREAVAEAA